MSETIFSAESTPISSQEEDLGIDLEKKAKKDEKLWTDEHSSDEEEFDPSKPADVLTTTQKEELEAEGDGNSGSSSQETTTEDDRDATDDSIVDDEVKYVEDVDKAKIVAQALLEKVVLKSSKKEALNAMMESLSWCAQ